MVAPGYRRTRRGYERPGRRVPMDTHRAGRAEPAASQDKQTLSGDKAGNRRDPTAASQLPAVRRPVAQLPGQPTSEYGEIEYGGLPVKPVVLHQMNQLPIPRCTRRADGPVVENWF